MLARDGLQDRESVTTVACVLGEIVPGRFSAIGTLGARSSFGCYRIGVSLVAVISELLRELCWQSSLSGVHQTVFGDCKVQIIPPRSGNGNLQEAEAEATCGASFWGILVKRYAVNV